MVDEEEWLPRRAATIVDDALADTRVVLVNGARQTGKTTLLRHVAADRGFEWRNLDNPSTRAAAQRDPEGFVRTSSPLVVDEIQRAPDLLLAIKEVVDADRRPGRFLLSGSARLLGLSSVPDVLPGRVETVELYPFSQGELDAAPDGFVDAAFDAGPGLAAESAMDRGDYAERIVRGGFPEAVARPDGRRRERFLESYVTDLVARDVADLSDIERVAQMQVLMRLLAAASGQLLVVNRLASDLGLPHRTVGRYLSLLEQVFLIKRVPAWSRNLTTRTVATTKVVMVDSGVTAVLTGQDSAALSRPDAPFGHLLEGFVVSELLRQLTWSRHRADLFHYRTRDQVEVDVVLEDRRGRVVGIEVKAARTVRDDDFRGLRHLQQRLGELFLAGFVLHTGPTTLPFGPKLRAVPVSALWTTGS